MKNLGDKENIEKEIDRMTLEYKLKQPQTLFAVWARKSPLTNQNPAQYSFENYAIRKNIVKIT
jgi:hypothetical protein